MPHTRLDPSRPVTREPLPDLGAAHPGTLHEVYRYLENAARELGELPMTGSAPRDLALAAVHVRHAAQALNMQRAGSCTCETDGYCAVCR